MAKETLSFHHFFVSRGELRVVETLTRLESILVARRLLSPSGPFLVFRFLY